MPGVTQPSGFADKVGFVWSVADLLRGDFKAHEYGQVILPLVVLRRMECALAPTKRAVVAKGEELADSPGRDAVLKAVAKHRFWNASPLDLTKILADAGTAARQLGTYLAGFSPSAREVLDAYGLPATIARLDKAGLLYQVLARFADLDLSETAVPNETMGYIFEELLRRFSEMSNETAGEHFTPTSPRGRSSGSWSRSCWRPTTTCWPARSRCAPCMTRPAAPAACSPARRPGCGSTTRVLSCRSTARRSTRRPGRSAGPT